MSVLVSLTILWIKYNVIIVLRTMCHLIIQVVLCVWIQPMTFRPQAQALISSWPIVFNMKFYILWMPMDSHSNMLVALFVKKDILYSSLFHSQRYRYKHVYNPVQPINYSTRHIIQQILYWTWLFIRADYVQQKLVTAI